MVTNHNKCKHPETVKQTNTFCLFVSAYLKIQNVRYLLNFKENPIILIYLTYTTNLTNKGSRVFLNPLGNV